MSTIEGQTLMSQSDLSVSDHCKLQGFWESVIVPPLLSMLYARHLEVGQIGALKKLQIKEQNARVKNFGHQNSSLQDR